jgi:formylglycine-generating enzyme required for sulfatase activity
VEGGRFDRESPAGSPADVSTFYLDKFEISVARFAKFLDAGRGTQQSPPTEGSGKHPHIETSGWSESWNSALLKEKKNLAPPVGTAGGLNCHEFSTWGRADATQPLNCMTWYEAFAFCIWDGGRLPTEAEWAYATAGGSEQRTYPWGDEPSPGANALLANWNCYFNSTSGLCSDSSIAPGGSAPDGKGKFGHVDLAGNVSEWILDWVSDSYPSNCQDCAQLTPAAERVVRGGDFRATNALELTSFRRASVKPSLRKETLGARCARDLPR